jgi:hypothetical protein
MRPHNLTYFEQLDAFKRELDHTNTRLTFSAIRFRSKHVGATTIEDFVEAVRSLATVFEKQFSNKDPLDVLFWGRKKLQFEAKNQNRSEVFRAWCRKAIKRLESDIQNRCDKFGNGKVVALV